MPYSLMLALHNEDMVTAGTPGYFKDYVMLNDVVPIF